MADKVKAGAIFVKEGASLPASLQFDSKPHSNGWSAVQHLDGFALGRKIREVGWTFFYMANEIRASAFAFDQEAAVSKAVQRLLAKLKFDKCNAVEITQVTANRFLGLPYMTVSAHARHIQESILLFYDQRRLVEGVELAAA